MKTNQLEGIMSKQQQLVEEAVRFLKERFTGPFPEIGIVLGSGLGILADQLADVQAVKTKDIPNWPKSTVQGHKGRVLLGNMDGTPVLALQGRVHYYEGYPIQQVVFYVRVFSQLGICKLILTNASGGLNSQYHPGDFMMAVDHINLMGVNPLIGPNVDSWGARFPDMSTPYDPEMNALAEKVGSRLSIPLRKGVLVATMGPSYETASEVRMMQTVGGDAVCMSTVPEVITAVQMGMRVTAIACITNMATGISKFKLAHDEVEAMAQKVKDTFARFIKTLVGEVSALKC